MGRLEGARRPRRHARSREDVLAATRAAGIRLPRPEHHRGRTASCCADADDAARCRSTLIEEPGSNNWVVGGKTVADRQTDRLERSAPRGHQPVAALHRAPERAGLERHRRGRAAVRRRRIGPQRDARLGPDDHRHRFQDVFVEDVNPANANEIMYNGKPEPLKIVTEEIKVKGEAPRTVELKFSRHGPVFYEDATHHKAYALRSASRAGHGVVPRRPAARSGEELQGVPRSGDVLEGEHREPDLRRRRRQHRLAGVGADAEPQGLGRPPAGAGHRQVRVGRLPDGSAARSFNPAQGFIATANNNINTDGLLAAGHVQDDQHRAVRPHHADPADRSSPAEMFTIDDSTNAAARRLLAARRRRSERCSAAGRHDAGGRSARAPWSRPGTRCSRKDSVPAADLHHLAQGCADQAGADHFAPAPRRSRRRRSRLCRRRSTQLTPISERRLDAVALGPRAHAGVPASVRDRLRSADRRAARRQRRGRRRRRQLPRNHRRLQLGSVA